MKKKRLVIAIPCFERHLYLRRLLNSILNLYKNLSIKLTILVVDNSNSNVIQKESERFLDTLDIKYIKNKENIGAGRNVLNCIEHADGDYLHILSDKVQLKKSYVEIVHKLISSNVDLAHLNYEGCEEEMNDTHSLKSKSDVSIKELSLQELIPSVNIGLTHLSCLFFKISYFRNIAFNQEINCSLIPQTYLFLAIAALKNRIHLVSDIAILISGNKSVAYSVVDVFYEDFLRALNPYLSKISFRSKLQFKIAHFWWLIKNLRTIEDERKLEIFNFIVGSPMKRFSIWFLAVAIINDCYFPRLLYKKNLITSKSNLSKK